MKEANDFIKKAYHIEASMQTYMHGITEARGEMECGMVDYVLNKMPKEQRDQTNLVMLSKQFILRVAGAESIESPS